MAAATTIEEALEVMTPDSVGVISPEATTTDEDSATDEETWLQPTPEEELRNQRELDREDLAETDTQARAMTKTTRAAHRAPQAAGDHASTGVHT